MTQNEILEVARQTGVLAGYEGEPSYLVIFAKTMMDIEREVCEAIEYDLAKSPAMFGTMSEYKAYKEGVQDYRTKIIARGSSFAATSND